MRGNPAHFHQPVALMARAVQRFYPLKMSRNSFFEWEYPARPVEGSAQHTQPRRSAETTRACGEVELWKFGFSCPRSRNRLDLATAILKSRLGHPDSPHGLGGECHLNYACFQKAVPGSEDHQSGCRSQPCDPRGNGPRLLPALGAITIGLVLHVHHGLAGGHLSSEVSSRCGGQCHLDRLPS
jgi:hypothetical protein